MPYAPEIAIGNMNECLPSHLFIYFKIELSNLLTYNGIIEDGIE
jgi:hypothetical protein